MEDAKPQVWQETQGLTGGSDGRREKLPGWWSRHWKWVVPVGCVTPVVLCGGLFALLVAVIFGAVKSSGAYQESLAMVRGSERVTALLGEPVEPGYFVTGNVNVEGAGGEAVLSYRVTGPGGSGTVYLEATKQRGRWAFEVLEVDVDGGAVVDLLE